MLLHFVPIRVFYAKPQVSFFDAGVNGSNGAYVVTPKNAISHPDNDNFE